MASYTKMTDGKRARRDSKKAKNRSKKVKKVLAVKTAALKKLGI